MISRLVIVHALAVLTLPAVTETAFAQRVTDTVVGSCVFSGRVSHCVRQYRYGDAGATGIKTVREPSPDDVAENRERERKWVERCRPVVRQDAYGVGRYVYTAHGCEYGRIED
jgi:hypothetical protein